MRGIDTIERNKSSGTTGLPKGCLFSHSNLVSLLIIGSLPQVYNRNSDDIVSGHSYSAHISGVNQLLMSINNGSQLVLHPKFNLSTFYEAIERHKITALSAPASVFMSLLKSGTHFDISSLKKVICGGAPLPRGCTQQIVAKYPHFEDFRQAYGHLLPANCMGEICVTGPTLFKGYHNNIEATNETIDCDNFLHTGDLGYYDQNDNLFILDRIKLLLKTDGMQVSPTELETIFLTHIAVQEVAHELHHLRGLEEEFMSLKTFPKIKTEKQIEIN
ncbi:unnamed protein product [Medioppia subpectinata]|nr:unnamed protein product [Medioppia subpectinata]CAG2107409.1 unnamed protein product [Medioppia subpectinata]